MPDTLNRLLEKSGSVAGELLEDFKQLLAPPLCVGCDGDLPEDDKLFCASCLEALKSKCVGDRPVCPFCGSKRFDNENCRYRSGSQAIRLYYWGRYEDEMIEYILKFKFQGVRELGVRLTDEALKSLSEPLRANNYDYIIPVPLHGRRLRKREYNQSEIIARRISKNLNIEYVPDSVLRVKSTKQQAKIGNENRRWKNVKGAFRLSGSSNIDFRSKRVLIVDDIVTTGATIFEASKPIREKNPEIVDIFSLAYAG
jgi:ComF family protein